MPSDGTASESPKWWIDQSKADEASKKPSDEARYGSRFYRAAEGYRQEVARSALSDTNRKLLQEGDPPENGFGYLCLSGEKSSEDRLDKIRRSIPLPPGARALVVDAGRMVRVLVTGSPPGDRILEFNFNRGEPTFDVWVSEEWREEILFRNVDKLRRAIPRLVEKYLGDDALARRELFV